MNQPDSQPITPDAKHLIQKQMDHIDLSGIMDTIQSDRYVPEVSYQQLAVRYPINEPGQIGVNATAKAYEVWKALKPEQNASIALFLEEIWNASKISREGFAPSFTPDTPKDEIPRRLATATEIIINQYTAAWRQLRSKRIKSTPKDLWTGLDRAFKRTSAITRFGHNNGIIKSQTPADIIGSGMFTASTIVGGLVGSLKDIAMQQKINLDAPMASRIIKKSYGSILTPFASMNQEVSVPMLNAIFDTPRHHTDISFFTLKIEADGTPALGIDHKKLLDIKGPKGMPILLHTPVTDTTWCLARLAKGEKKEVMREHFEWLMGLMDTYYFPYAFPQKHDTLVPVISPAQAEAAG